MKKSIAFKAVKLIGIVTILLVAISLFIPRLNKDGGLVRTIHVKVTDASTGKPIEGAKVCWLNDDGTPVRFGNSVPSDPEGEGSFQLVAGFGATTGIVGSYDESIETSFLTEADGYERRITSLNVSHDRRTVIGLHWPIPSYHLEVELVRIGTTTQP